ncbi:MAG: methyltransferase [Candidatus Daviesbacteria bacterium]|nr:methyltransferase [Candidatus Daviesbacteria bacterium]
MNKIFSEESNKIKFLYSLKTIPNTEEFVENELISKFPKIKIVSKNKGKIIFQTENYSISEFRAIHSALLVDNNHSIQHNLYRRNWRVDFIPAGINPALAYILCQVASLNKDDILLDPFCGGSTIPITALLYFDINKAFASDVSGRAIDVSEKCFQASGITKNRFVLFRSNVSMIKLKPKTITKVITNMPFGIRSGDHEKNIKLYNIFNLKLRSMLTDNGVIVLLTQEKNLVYETMGKNFNIKLIMVPEQGGLRPGVFRLTKKT